MLLPQIEAGRQRKGWLWSTLGDVCGLLKVPAIMPGNSGESLFQHVRFVTGERIYRIGEAFDTLYIVSSGFLKTVQLDDLGNEQVLSFPMRGDVLGADGIHSSRCVSEAVALSDCDLVLVPFRKLAALSRAHREVENLLYRMMSRELVHRQVIIGMLGAASAEARVARFLLSLAERFVEMGYSSKLFNLRMTRQEIGNYLGLTLETVSRTLSALNEAGLITVHQRAVGINDPEALRNLRRLPPARLRSRRARQTVRPGPKRAPSAPAPAGIAEAAGEPPQAAATRTMACPVPGAGTPTLEGPEPKGQASRRSSTGLVPNAGASR